MPAQTVLTNAEILQLMQKPGRTDGAYFLCLENNRLVRYNGEPPASQVGKFRTTSYKTRRYLPEDGIVAYKV